MGMDLSKVADQMGHADIQMLVSRYLNTMTKNSNEAAKHLSDALLNKDNNSGGIVGGTAIKNGDKC